MKLKNLALVFVLVMMVISGCQSNIFTPPSPPEIIQNLTTEQIENITSHSYGNNCIVRWPDGSVIRVYDETNFSLIDEVLNEWNEVIAPKISLIKTDNKDQAAVVITFQQLDNNGGRAWVWYDNEYRIYKGLIGIDSDIFTYLEANFGKKALEHAKGLYLHEMGHILGLNNHLDDGLMATPYQSNYVDPLARQFIWLLYELPVGWCF